MPCDTWPRSRTVLIRNPAGSVTAPVASVWAGLKLLARRNSNSGRSGSKRVDLAVDDLVARPVLALLDDDPPAEDADLLDGVGVRDRLDGVDRLDAGELTHGDLRCRDSQIDTGSRGCGSREGRGWPSCRLECVREGPLFPVPPLQESRACLVGLAGREEEPREAVGVVKIDRAVGSVRPRLRCGTLLEKERSCTIPKGRVEGRGHRARAPSPAARVCRINARPIPGRRSIAEWRHPRRP